MRVFGADIGGTKTLLSLACREGGKLRILAERRVDSRAFPGIDEMLHAFLSETVASRGERPSIGCLAVAGPLGADRRSARVTNLPWDIDAEWLEARFGLPLVLINDFEAQARAIPTLGPGDMRVLQPGVPLVGAPRAIVGAGTGFGFAQLVTVGGGEDVVLASEAGHAGFSPADAREVALQRWIGERLGEPVTIEHVLSGPGLSRIYRFLAEASPDAPTFLGSDEGDEDIGAEITAAALGGKNALAQAALDLFLSAYGSQCGSLALVSLPRGGLFVSGGIAARLVETIADGGRFVRAFNARGRMAWLMSSIPVAVVTNDRAGLAGALETAAKHLPCER